MSRDVEPIVETVASAIADGAPIDWDEAFAQATSDRSRLLLRRLRAAATIAGAHHAIERGAATVRRPAGDAPARWGSLEILTRLGGGAFGDVFVARDPALDREVALKLLKPAPPERPLVTERVVNEGRAMARVRHPNVVTVYGADTHDGRVGIAMELVRGRSLESILVEGGPLSAAEAAAIGLDLARALAAVHAQGIVHGDVKTQNVLREEGGRILLADFGASGLLGAKAAGESVEAGTPYYMAPELFRGSPASRKSDLYALGVLLYRLVSGGYPVTGTTFAELVAKHGESRPRPLRDVRADLPADFVAAVEKAIAPDPADRYASAGEMEAALAATVGGARTRSTRRRWLVAGVAAGVLAIGSTATYFLLDDSYFVSTRLCLVEAGRLVPLASGDSVSRGDKLRLEFRASRPLHVYVLNEDADGKKTVLFPLRSTVQNPLPASDEAHVLPAPTAQWVVSTPSRHEDVILVASLRPLDGFMANLASVPRASEKPNDRIPDDEIVVRGIDELVVGALELDSASGPRSIRSGSSARLADIVLELTESSERVSGVFVRRVRLLHRDS